MEIKTLTEQEIAEEKRRRQMAIIKASNQMLKDAKETAMSKTSDPVKKAELQQQFSRAIKDNESMAKTYLHASMEEVDKSQYRDADESEIVKYNDRLKKRGITDEEVHRKDSASVTVGKKGEKTIQRRKRRGAAKDLGDDYKPLENEEELMRQSLVTDDSQIEKQIEKNRKIEEEMHKEGKDIVRRIRKTASDEMIGKKISVEDNSDRVEVKNTKDENGVKMEKKEEIKQAEVEKVVKKKETTEVLTYDFDFSSIPSYVQYDVIPLPSKGQCYPKNSPLRCGRVPVAYLTAADENIISSPNVYRDGKLLDIIVGRKILDKRINVNELNSGDRDAIILWLRGTSYGDEFPIFATNPENGKQYNVTVNLSQFEYFDFNLEGDEDGLFEYETNNGDKIKFKFLTNLDEEKLRNAITRQVTDYNKLDVLKLINNITGSLNRIEFSDEEVQMLNEDIDEIKEIVGTDITENGEETYPAIVTEQMIIHTVSVNGNEDREYIKNYIENMRSKAAMDYRNYFINNKPGVDFNFTVNIPESDGGGSFNTFLRIEDTVFINF